MYSKKTIKHFKNPKYAGEMKNYDAVGEVGNVKCLLPQEEVHVNNKIINIKDISKKEKILSQNGKYHKLSKVHSRTHNGKIITIKNKLGKTILTNEHLVYAIKIPKKRKFFDTIVKKTLIPAWYHAEDLEKRDIVLYPIFKEVIDRKYIEVDLSKPKYDFRSIGIPKKIKLSANFLRLCGYFIAEGHATVKMCRNSVRIAFNIREKEYIEDVKNITKRVFNLKPSVIEDKKKNTAIIMINNVFVSKLFKKLFGCGAKNKKIPDFMMLLPPNKQKNLICGMWRGDGHISLKREWPRAGYATISKQLAHQIKILLLRQKIIPSIYIDKERIKNGVHHKEAYRIHVGERDSMIKLMRLLNIKYKYSKKIKENSWFDDNYFYTPISGFVIENYKGEVYNLEVPETHSFTTNSLLVHNCGDIMRIYLKIKNSTITDISFLTYGCIAAIAASDAMCKLVKDKTIKQALKITSKDIAKELDNLPPKKFHCSVLGTKALKKAIDNYKNKIKPE